VRFKVFTTVKIKVEVLQVVTPCSHAVLGAFVQDLNLRLWSSIFFTGSLQYSRKCTFKNCLTALMFCYLLTFNPFSFLFITSGQEERWGVHRIFQNNEIGGRLLSQLSDVD
jgi:hypothetical protein